MSDLVARIGVAVPGLTLSGNSHCDWEKSATVEEMAAIVAAADRLGYSHVTCAEHIGVPADQAPRRGSRYFDPLATFGYFSAVTSQIRFVTAVLVLGYHHPLEIAKRYGTLDVISGGRVTLGLGVGTLKEEFDLLGLGGAEFTERGARADDALRALRASIGRSLPEYHGPYYDFGGLIVDPCAIQQNMPLWIGGRSLRSLRRAITLADGWTPFGMNCEEMAAMIASAREWPSWHERENPLEIVLPAEFMIDPLGQPEQTADYLRRLFAAGATKASVHFRSNSCAHFIEQLEAQAELAV
jgi:probable F420-dependent oxidoreductase